MGTCGIPSPSTPQSPTGGNTGQYRTGSIVHTGASKPELISTNIGPCSICSCSPVTALPLLLLWACLLPRQPVLHPVPPASTNLTRGTDVSTACSAPAVTSTSIQVIDFHLPRPFGLFRLDHHRSLKVNKFYALRIVEILLSATSL